MNGIDARLLGDGRAAWNCASVGQEPAESLLVADVLPPSVRTIVIGITVEKLVVSNTSIPPNKYVGYVMSGYSPSPSVRAVARQLPDGKLDALLRTSRIRVVIWSRWVVRALADLIARRALRPNLDLERARVDLYHPAPYTRAVSAAALDHLIAINFNSWRGHFAPTSGVMTVLKGIRDLAAARGQRVVFVIMPEHPARRPRSSAQFYMELAQWVNRSRSESFEIIDLHDSLGADGFFDNVHPGGNGTVQLTRRLDAELKRGRN
jgi:hypothetical protein